MVAPPPYAFRRLWFIRAFRTVDFLVGREDISFVNLQAFDFIRPIFSPPKVKIFSLLLIFNETLRVSVVRGNSVSAERTAGF